MLTTAAPSRSPSPAVVASLVQVMAAIVFTSKILRSAAASVSTSRPNTGLMPVLLTRMSSPPNASTVAATAAAWCSGSSALPATPIA
jgi:hypothetical protein